MVKKMKLVPLMLSVVLMLTLFLNGCGQKPDREGSGNGTGKSADKPGASGENMIGNMYKEGLPIVKEKVTFNFVSNKDVRMQDFEDMVFFKKMEEKTNIHIDWELVDDSNWAQKKNLILASGEWPDAFYMGLGYNDVAQYGPEGVFIKLDDLIEKYCPNIQKAFEEEPLYRRLCTSADGNIYSLGYANEDENQYNSDQLFIYKPWLDKLELPVPSTLDEFYDTLKAFKNDDPNGNGKPDEIPFSFRANNRIQGLISLFGSFGRVDPTNHIIVEGGKIVFTADKLEYKKAIAYFHTYFKEGLFDPEGFTQDIKQYFAKGKTEEVTLGSFMLWNAENMAGTERAENYVPVPPLKGPGGHQIWRKYNGNNGSINGAGFAITKSCNNPEIIMRWVDQMYEKKNSAQIIWGALDIVLKEGDSGILEFNPTPEGMGFDEFRRKNAPLFGPSALFAKDYGKVVMHPDFQKSKMKIKREVYDPYLTDESLPGIPYTKEESDWLASSGEDINNYVDDNRAKWLLNGGIEKEWDEYLKRLEQLKLAEHLDMLQNAYDRFIK